MSATRKVRFAIARDEPFQVQSEIWTVFVRKSDVYLTCDAIAGAMKLSLHGSGVCQYARLSEFHDKYADKINRKDRTIYRWRRQATPAIGPLHVASIVFAAYETWDHQEDYQNDKQTFYLAPPTPGWGTEVAVLYSREDPDEHCGDTPPSEIYIARFQLENGDYVTIIPRPTPLPDGLFDQRIVPQETMMMSFGFSPSDLESHDLRGFSILTWETIANNGLLIWSLHNMRSRTIHVDDVPRLMGFGPIKTFVWRLKRWRRRNSGSEQH